MPPLQRALLTTRAMNREEGSAPLLTPVLAESVFISTSVCTGFCNGDRTRGVPTVSRKRQRSEISLTAPVDPSH